MRTVRAHELDETSFGVRQYSLQSTRDQTTTDLLTTPPVLFPFSNSNGTSMLFCKLLWKLISRFIFVLTPETRRNFKSYIFLVFYVCCGLLTRFVYLRRKKQLTGFWAFLSPDSLPFRNANRFFRVQTHTRRIIIQNYSSLVKQIMDYSLSCLFHQQNMQEVSRIPLQFTKKVWWTRLRKIFKCPSDIFVSLNF